VSPLLLELRGTGRVVERFAVGQACPVVSRVVLTGQVRVAFCFTSFRYVGGAGFPPFVVF